MATRTVTRFIAHFDDLGNLQSFEAPARIDTPETYPNPDGGDPIDVVIWVSYKVRAADLPPAFVANLESVHQQVVNKLDSDYPM